MLGGITPPVSCFETRDVLPADVIPFFFISSRVLIASLYETEMGINFFLIFEVSHRSESWQRLIG
jgi:hypothetical protein